MVKLYSLHVVEYRHHQKRLLNSVYCMQQTLLACAINLLCGLSDCNEHALSLIGFCTQILLKNVTDACLATVTWYIVGYGLAFGDNGSGNGETSERQRWAAWDELVISQRRIQHATHFEQSTSSLLTRPLHDACRLVTLEGFLDQRLAISNLFTSFAAFHVEHVHSVRNLGMVSTWLAKGRYAVWPQDLAFRVDCCSHIAASRANIGSQRDEQLLSVASS
jgi:hypothetical protein